MKGCIRGSTFRARLTWTTTLLAMAVLLLTAVGIYFGAWHALKANLDASLLSIARAEIASAIDGPGGSVHVHEEEPVSIDLPTGSGYEKYAQIEDDSGRIVARTANLQRGLPLRLEAGRDMGARAKQIVFGDVSLGGQALRGIYYPLKDSHGTPLLAVIAVSQRPMQNTLRALLYLLVAALLAGTGAAAALACRLSLYLTRPLRHIAGAAQNIDQSHLDVRIPQVSADIEFQDVTKVLNGMLARLEAAAVEQRTLFTAQQRFIADASHELRSPLCNLRGTIEVAARRERSTKEYQETLEVALGETKRMSRLVDDLLTLSRADAGQFRLNLAPCDIASLARESVRAHESSAEQAGIQLVLEDSPPALVSGDADRLRQALDNLLDNALCYTPRQSQVTVSVRTEGAVCRLTVHDSGPGVAPEESAYLFDRFFRSDKSRSRRSGGAGLGLAIAKAIVEAHCGTITVDSQPGRGSAFQICLPYDVVPSSTG